MTSAPRIDVTRENDRPHRAVLADIARVLSSLAYRSTRLLLAAIAMTCAVLLLTGATARLAFGARFLRENERANRLARLPQNVWWTLQRAWTNDDASVSSLYAVVVARDRDGLVAIKPVNWYVYYVLGGDFYYLINESDATRGAGDETSCLIFAATSDSDEKRSVLRRGRLNLSQSQLLRVFANERCNRVVPLDDLLLPGNPRVDVVLALNRLIDLGAL